MTLNRRVLSSVHDAATAVAAAVADADVVVAKGFEQTGNTTNRLPIQYRMNTAERIRPKEDLILMMLLKCCDCDCFGLFWIISNSGRVDLVKVVVMVL